MAANRALGACVKEWRWRRYCCWRASVGGPQAGRGLWWSDPPPLQPHHANNDLIITAYYANEDLITVLWIYEEDWQEIYRYAGYMQGQYTLGDIFGDSILGGISLSLDQPDAFFEEP